MKLATPELSLSPEVASELMAEAGLAGQWIITRLFGGNHIFLLESEGGRFFLKAHTRSWYAWDWRRGPSLAVRHETAAWESLRRRGLATPDVVIADETGGSALGWPYIVTRELPGAPAGRLLEASGLVRSGAVLAALGDYLRRMHAITFEHAGYVTTADGPPEALDVTRWHHAIHAPEQWQGWAQAALETAPLSAALRDEVAERYATMADVIRAEYEPPRFTHGDSHASHYYIDLRGGPRVTGVVDMEVASAGDPFYDLVLVVVELMARLDARTRWWEPLFVAHGGAPDLERMRLGLLATGEADFKAHGHERWPAPLERTYRAILDARSYEELFSANRAA